MTNTKKNYSFLNTWNQLTVCKQITSFKNKITYKLYIYESYV